MSIYKNDEPYKLYRVGDPHTSEIGAKKVESAKLKQFVYSEIIAAGEKGITGKEICAKHPHLPYSSITARPKSLKEDNLIYYRGDRRDGARIIRAVIGTQQFKMNF